MDTTYEKTYSLKDVAKRIGKPVTTVSTWRSQYESYLPVVGNGRNRRYKQEALEILTLIARLKDDQVPHDQIEDILRDTASEITIYDDRDQETPPILQELMQGYSGILSVVKDQRETMQRQEETIRHLREKLDSVDKRIEDRDKEAQERDRVMKEKLESIDQRMKEREDQEKEDQESGKKEKGWLQRIFGGE